MVIMTENSPVKVNEVPATIPQSRLYQRNRTMSANTKTRAEMKPRASMRPTVSKPSESNSPVKPK